MVATNDIPIYVGSTVLLCHAFDATLVWSCFIAAIPPNILQHINGMGSVFKFCTPPIMEVDATEKHPQNPRNICIHIVHLGSTAEARGFYY